MQKQGEHKTYYEHNYYDKSIKIYIKEICNYVNDKLHGEYTLYREGGGIAETCDYVNGKKHGKHIYRDTNGYLLFKHSKMKFYNVFQYYKSICKNKGNIKNIMKMEISKKYIIIWIIKYMANVLTIMKMGT